MVLGAGKIASSEGFFESFRGFETDSFRSLNLHRFTRFGIASHPGGPLSHDEGAESDQLNVSVFFDPISDGIEDSRNGTFSSSLGSLASEGTLHIFYKFSFVHCSVCTASQRVRKAVIGPKPLKNRPFTPFSRKAACPKPESLISSRNSTVSPVPPLTCPFLDIPPEIHPTAFVAPGADLMGAVTLEENSSVWYGCVLRADIERIRIGRGSNIQDGAIVHLSSHLGTMVGDFVTCGHRAILHACRIDDEVLVGMGAIIMDGAEIGARSIIAAGSLLTKGQKVPPGSLVMGSPAKVVRSLDHAEQMSNRALAEKYIQVAREHREFLKTR
jgi:carbonic anhydrase/acetyltransferase-like protein (isoleucine patch superfamily)